MIRKLYTILLIGLCLNLVACGDDNENIDPNASAPVIKFPMEQLDVDLNKVDNLPVVAVIKSQAGLQSVTMKIQTVEGTVEYKTVTDFFNPNSYSLSENLEYNANYQAFIIEATDKLNHIITGTLPISVTDVVERPVITFDPEEIIYDEMDENPTIPRTTFKITSEAGLKTVEMYLVSASGQESKGIINLSGEKEYTFDEMIDYNIEVAQHNWCCDDDSPCKQYYDGIITRKELDSISEEDGFVCYESQMLRNWTAFLQVRMLRKEYLCRLSQYVEYTKW